MQTVLVGREAVVPGPGEVRRSNLGRALITTVIASALVGAVMAAEALWPLPIDAARARTAIETAIMVSALLSIVTLRLRLTHTRWRADLLLLAGLASLSVTDLVWRALPALNAYPSHSIHDLQPVLIILAVASFGALFAAGLSFADQPGEESGGWLLAGASFVLATAAPQQLMPSPAGAVWVTPAELLQVAGYALLFAAGVRCYRGARQRIARAAALGAQERIAREAVNAERVRIARDLHDGLAQDLAFIAANEERLKQAFGEGHPLVVAAHRALAISRGAIVDLEASAAPSTADALREVAAELQARHGVTIAVRVDAAAGEQPEPNATQRQELVRIAREAIANAVRHGSAHQITVTLGSRGNDLLLRVADDGCGLDDPAARANPGTGRGMHAMHDRARAAGWRLVARRRVEGGTEISVVGHAHGPSRRR